MIAYDAQINTYSGQFSMSVSFMSMYNGDIYKLKEFDIVEQYVTMLKKSSSDSNVVYLEQSAKNDLIQQLSISIENEEIDEDLKIERKAIIENIAY